MACSMRTVRSTGPLSLPGLVGLAVALSSSWALASSGLGVIGNPGQVAVVPAATARVQLTGLFAVGVSGSDPCYSPPQCGTLYYACPAGEEARCQMEWGELKDAAATGKCVGFGSPRGSAGTPLNNGRVRMPGEPLGEPDVYPLGLGVHVGPCTGLEFACSQGLDVSATRAQSCAGASDGGVVTPVPGTGGTTPTSGTTGTGGGNGGVSGGSGSGSGGATAVDAGGKGETGGKSGCSLAASTSMSGAWLLLLGLWGAVARRRRRHRAGSPS